MTTQQPFSPLDLPDTPPQPAWPKVVGIVSICLGTLGLVCGGCGLGALVFMPTLLGSQAGSAGLPPTMHLHPVQWGLAFLGLAMAGVAIGGGVMCLRRNPVARLVLLVYAAAAVPQVLINVYFQLQQQAAMEQWVRENPESPFAKGNSSAGAAIGIIISVILGLAWPVFLLVWFGVFKRTAESFGRRDEPIRV